MQTILVVFAAMFLLAGVTCRADIWEPEGVNMPGAWNSWNNPPLNNLALASYTQVPGGRVTKIPTGIPRWQTVFSVAASGGDIVGGTYPWLFTSGPPTNYYQNKWAGVTISMNTLQSYTFNTGPDNNITLVDGKWYTMNFEDAGYADNRAIFMETSALPVDISSVSVPSLVDPGSAATVTLTMAQIPALEELFYLRYSTDAWATSGLIPVSMSGISGTAIIPGQIAGTVVSYYAFSSTVASITADYDLYTIKLNSNGGLNYAYTVTSPTPVITFANLQGPATGTIGQGSVFQVSGRAEIPGVTGQPVSAPGLLAWVGYSSSNTNPSTWTTWIAAPYTGPVAGSDEFTADLGSAITSAGTWYYATRFSLNGGAWLYGGFSAGGGGFWNGTDNISGVLTIQASVVPILRTLQNITVAAEQIQCYDAKQTITVAGDPFFFHVENGGMATLIAGQNIVFLPGTIVVSGGYLWGKITTTDQYCGVLGPVLKDVVSGAGDAQQPLPWSSGLRVYPNPASSLVTVELRGVAAGAESRMELFGIQGNRIGSNSITGPGSCSFSVADLPSGVYMLRIVSGSEVQTRMVVKQN